MSELREECYKCLNNQKCVSAAEYGSILCMTNRKYNMPNNNQIENKTIKQEKIRELRIRISNNIDNSGGVEGFNQNKCANEIITHWIDEILEIIEEG